MSEMQYKIKNILLDVERMQNMDDSDMAACNNLNNVIEAENVLIQNSTNPVNVFWCLFDKCGSNDLYLPSMAKLESAIANLVNLNASLYNINLYSHNYSVHPNFYEFIYAILLNLKTDLNYININIYNVYASNFFEKLLYYGYNKIKLIFYITSQHDNVGYIFRMIEKFSSRIEIKCNIISEVKNFKMAYEVLHDLVLLKVENNFDIKMITPYDSKEDTKRRSGIFITSHGYIFINNSIDGFTGNNIYDDNLVLSDKFVI